MYPNENCYQHSESVEEVIYSDAISFSIDTKNPDAEVINPNGGDMYQPDDIMDIEWSVGDENILEEGVSINLCTRVDNSGMIPINVDDITSGSYQYSVPNITTSNGRIRVDVFDSYGNHSVDYSDDWFTIGNSGEITHEYTNAYSEAISFSIDTRDPDITLHYPNGGEAFDSEQNIQVSWSANDQNLIASPISISISTDLYSTFIDLATNITDLDSTSIDLPDLFNENQVGMKITCVDDYGNSSYDYSDGFFSVGQVSVEDIVYATTTVYSDYDEGFSIDTRDPSIDLIYPVGGEHIINYEDVALTWSANELDLDCQVFVSHQIGGWYVQALSDFSTNNLVTNISLDLSVAGVVPETRWGWLKVSCSDIYGNVASAQVEDYIIYGEPTGELDSEWLSSEDNIIVLDWGWRNGQLIAIDADALSFLENGDIIAIVDENAILNESCGGGYGELTLSSHTYTGQDGLFAFKVYCGADNCEQGGTRVPGYQVGNNITFQHTDVSAGSTTTLTPNEMGIAVSIIFDNGIAIVNEFTETDPDSVENSRYKFYSDKNILTSLNNRFGLMEGAKFNRNDRNYDSSSLNNRTGLIEGSIFNRNDRDFDSYSIYRRTNQANLRDCTDEGCSIVDEECICLIAHNVTQTYYFDNYASSTNNQWCYEVFLLDNQIDQNEVLKTIDSCIGTQIDLIWGDANEDGVLNVLDVVMLVAYILGNTTLGELGTIQADYNQDGAINVLDVVSIVYNILSI